LCQGLNGVQPQSSFDDDKTWLIIVLHEFLNDDDEEIRDIAAEIVSKYLAPTSLTHLSAVSQLQWILQNELAGSKNAIGMGLLKLCDACQSPFPALRLLRKDSWWTKDNCDSTQLDIETFSVSKQLQSALAEKTELFEVEKQNLYLDECQEARFWQEVLSHSRLAQINPATIEAFSRHVLKGVNTLLQEIDERRDSPLDWTSDEKVFVIGFRLLSAAKVLCIWNKAQRPMEQQDIAKLLQAFQKILQKDGQRLNHTWAVLATECNSLIQA
jgi:hypothetical protein